MGHHARKNMYTTEANNTLNNCQVMVYKELYETDNVTQDQISEFCLHGTYDDYGSRFLNHRLYRYFAELLSSSSKYKSLPFKVGIFNDRAIESCPYTENLDG